MMFWLLLLAKDMHGADGRYANNPERRKNTPDKKEEGTTAGKPRYDVLGPTACQIYARDRCWMQTIQRERKIHMIRKRRNDRKKPRQDGPTPTVGQRYEWERCT